MTQRRPWAGGGQYTLLLSAASEAVYGPELVLDDRFDRSEPAVDLGQRIVSLAGLEYELMREVDGKWISNKGETAEEVIKRRWDYGDGT
jgi:hypothetical protein